MKEEALRKRFVRWSERYNQRTKSLQPLRVGNRCFIQNQTGQHKRRWDRSGLVVEVLPHDKYLIKVDGSNRLTIRNRRFLRLLKNASTTISDAVHPGQPTSWKEWRPSSSNSHPNITESNDVIDIDTTGEPPLLPDYDTSEDRVEENYERDIVPVENHQQHQRHEHESLDESCNRTQTTKEPLALRRLERFNSKGLKEDDNPVSTRLRPR